MKCSNGCCRVASPTYSPYWFYASDAGERAVVRFCPRTGERLDFDADGSPRVTPGVWGEQVAEIILALQLASDPGPGTMPCDILEFVRGRNVRAHIELAREIIAERKEECSPLDSIVGKWPGDETDEEIERALAELRGSARG